MLDNFVICGQISYQQESSQRVILDLSDYISIACSDNLMYGSLKMMSRYIESNGKHTFAVNQKHPKEIICLIKFLSALLQMGG